MYKERTEVMAETPDYNFSQMPFCYGRLSKFFGKRMSTHGPPTQMALAGVTITPYARALELAAMKTPGIPTMS